MRIVETQCVFTTISIWINSFIHPTRPIKELVVTCNNLTFDKIKKKVLYDNNTELVVSKFKSS